MARKLSLGDALDEFIRFQKGNNKKGTIDTYMSKMKPLRQWEEHTREQLKPTMNKWRVGDISNYLEYLATWKTGKGKPLTISSLASYRRALHAFLKWAHDNNITKKDLSKAIRPTVVPKKIVRTLSTKQMRALIEGTGQSTYALRDHAIIRLLLDTGLRVNELCMLTISDIDQDTHEVFVRCGKGDKSRTVYIHQTTVQVIREYISNSRPQTASALFVSRTGEALTTNGIDQMLKRTMKRAGLEGIHAHLLRYTFATKAHENGMSENNVSDIMGHATLEMTKGYIHTPNAALRAAHARFSPVAAL